MSGRAAGGDQRTAAPACAPPPLHPRGPRKAAYALRRLLPLPFFPPLRAAFHALVCAADTAWISGSDRRRRALSRATRLLPSALHAFEQYRALRSDVENSLPHSLQLTAVTMQSSRSAFALHCLQWIERWPRLYGAKLRPHSAQAFNFPAFALRLGPTPPRPAGDDAADAGDAGRGDRPPRSLAMRAALHALALASLRACFLGSAMRLRWLSAPARRLPPARHASEQ